MKAGGPMLVPPEGMTDAALQRAHESYSVAVTILVLMRAARSHPGDGIIGDVSDADRTDFAALATELDPRAVAALDTLIACNLLPCLCRPMWDARLKEIESYRDRVADELVFRGHPIAEILVTGDDTEV